MKSKVIFLVISTLLCAGCSSVSRVRTKISSQDINFYVFSVIVPEIEAGPDAVWAQIDVVGDGQSATLFLPYLGKTQHLPSEGKRCRFAIEKERIEGLVGRQSMILQDEYVVEHFSCP